MGWKSFNYICTKCDHTYASLIDDREPAPDPCPECGSTEVNRTLGAVNAITTYVPDYPGANYHRAGYAHDLRRPAEKAGRQVAMPRSFKP